MCSIKYIFVAILALLVAGCVEERVIWSPDGTHALVIGDDGLHVCDSAGNLSPLLVPHAKTAQWLPDGKRAVVVSLQPKADKSVDHIACVYTITDASATPGATIYQRVFPRGGIQHMRVSPTGDAVALSVDIGKTDNDSGPAELIVVATDGSGKLFDCGPAADYPDWSPDGQSIVFIRPYNLAGAKDGVCLGVLTRHQVVNTATGVIDSRQPWSPPPSSADDLAGMIFDQSSRVRVAKDGRIFFSATEITLPTTIADLPASSTIFVCDPARQSTLTRVLPLGAVQNLGDATQFFELSQDARYLSIPFSDGRVSILTIATGDAQIVQPVGEPDKQGNVRLAMIPLWRNADELTFARPMPDGIHHEVVLYAVNEKTATVLSSDWPTDVLNLVNKPTTQPTTAPAGP
jgi:hypothetical protein